MLSLTTRDGDREVTYQYDPLDAAITVIYEGFKPITVPGQGERSIQRLVDQVGRDDPPELVAFWQQCLDACPAWN